MIVTATLLVATSSASLLTASPASGIYRAPPQPSRTTCVRLTGRLGATRRGPRGQTFTPINLYNSSGKSCTLTGVPHLIYNEDIEVAVRLGLSAARVAT